MINSADFARRLQEIMEHYQLTASSFAESIGVQRSAISHILSGRNKPSLDFILKILDTFPDIELYWLLNGKGSGPIRKEDATTPDQDLFSVAQPAVSGTEIPPSMDTAPEVLAELTRTARTPERKIVKVVVFYNDHTFEEISNG